MSKGNVQDGPLNRYLAEAGTEGQLVKISGSTEKTVAICGAGEVAYGVLLQDGAANDLVSVEMLTKDGTVRVISAAAITANADLYAAANGRVSSTPNGRKLGHAEEAADGAGEFLAMVPLPSGSADVENSQVVFEDDFHKFDLDESGSEGMWVADANDSGGLAVEDHPDGRVLNSPSDGTVGDNDETYGASINTVYKPTLGKKAHFKFYVVPTETAGDASNFIVGLTSHSVDLADALGNDGAGPQDADTHICFWKEDGDDKWQGNVRDTALDNDANVGTLVDGEVNILELDIRDTEGDATTQTVTFFVNGVPGGSLTFLLSAAANMRLFWGSKNGAASQHALLRMDKIFMSRDRYYRRDYKLTHTDQRKESQCSHPVQPELFSDRTSVLR